MKKQSSLLCLLTVLLFLATACASNANPSETPSQESSVVEDTSSTEQIDDSEFTTDMAIEYAETLISSFSKGDEQAIKLVFDHIQQDVLEQGTYFEDIIYNKKEMFETMSL